MAAIDVLIVSLGGTAGLREADAELTGSLQRAGASVVLAPVERPREWRTLAAIELAWALNARRAARAAIAAHQPRSIVYSTTTAALLAPTPGTIRFDAPAAGNRPGRHGIWQRPIEARRMAAAPLLAPWSEGGLAEAPRPHAPALVVPVPIERSGAPGERDIAAITYGANPDKKGLDRVLAAWLRDRREGEELIVAGLDARTGAAWLERALRSYEADGGAAEPAWSPRRIGAGANATGATKPAQTPHSLGARADPDVTGTANRALTSQRLDSGGTGVRFAGMLARSEYRALLRRARVFVTAPRREDYGIAQLEALADGCMLVTTASPGPYAALPLARALDPRLVGDGLNLRAALDDPAPDYAERATAAIWPFTAAAVDRVVAERLLPRLLA